MYSLIELPQKFNKDMYSFDKLEAKEYYEWFNLIKNERLDVLKNHVQLEYPDWELEYSRTSLIDLYSWFSKNICLERISEKEISKIKEQINQTPLFNNVIDIPEYVYSAVTASVCFDVGIYLGETLIKNNKDVKWGQKINSKNYIDYVQPILISKNYKVPINPRRAAESLAYDILYKTIKKETFLDLFDDLKIKFN